MSFSTGVLVIGLFFVAALVLVICYQSSMRNEIEGRLRALPDFTVSHFYANEKGGVAIDEQRGQICVVRSGGDSRRYSFDKVIATELVEDGDSVTKTNRGGQLVGAAVGAAVLGAPGAIVGGLSGSTRTKAKISRVEVLLYVDDLAAPAHRINFLDLGSSVARDGFIARAAFDQAYRWHAMFKAIIHRANPTA